jgi:predicted DNA binding CopG/RHH family protein
MKRPVQYFSKEYLEQTKNITPSQAAEFVENYQKMIHANEGKTKLISMRVPIRLLENFQTKAKMEGSAYQTKIVDLMRKWILS